jgi:hypothetical protein
LVAVPSTHVLTATVVSVLVLERLRVKELL